MSAFNLTFTAAKGNFFDRAKVEAAMDRATKKSLSKIGAFVRRKAKGLIRKRKKISEPGHPPSSHTGLLRNFIFFSYDAARKSVVIGPVKLNFGTGQAPRALELGGQSTIRSGGRRGRGKTRIVTIRARPYMRPALQLELAAGTIPAAFENSIPT